MVRHSRVATQIHFWIGKASFRSGLAYVRSWKWQHVEELFEECAKHTAMTAGSFNPVPMIMANLAAAFTNACFRVGSMIAVAQ